VSSRHRTALAVMDEDPDQAAGIAHEILREDPNDKAALFILGVVNSRAERFGTSIALYERITRLDPRRHEAWNNLGMALMECGDYPGGRNAFKRAIEIKETAGYIANIAATYLQEGNPVEALKWAKRSLNKGEDDKIWTTYGFANLGIGNWKEGWQGYEKCLGGRFRKIVQVGEEPRWDGGDVENLFIYGEQGLGDEIMYASCLEDAQKHAKHIVLECDKRLAGLFQRSFPEIEVHGTRRDEQNWAKGRSFDAGSAIGSLAYLFRPDRALCPRKPYLVADPERRLQWRALFDSWGARVVGLAWTGGRVTTHKRERTIGLEAFRPLIQKYTSERPTVFVSLQYKEPFAEIEEAGLPVRHIARGVQSPDYEDTAAFVMELDEVIGIHTTIHHLAGAMGKKSTVLVPSKPMWNYATGNDLPWYPDNKFFRQKPNEAWVDCIKRLANG